MADPLDSLRAGGPRGVAAGRAPVRYKKRRGALCTMPVEIVAGDEAKAYDVIGAGMRGKKDRKMISEQKKASSTVAAHVRGRNSRKKAD